MALSEHDVDVLVSMVGGRINAVRANKQLDDGERKRLSAEYEEVQLHLIQLQRENGWGRWAEGANRGVSSERASEAAMRELADAEAAKKGT